MRCRRGAMVMAAVAAVLVLMASACSDSGSSKGETSTADDSVAKAAKAEVDPVLARPTSIGITEVLDGTIPTGKTVYWIQCGAPTCVSLGDSLAEATDELGWKLVRIEAGLSPETVKNAWGEAARANPAPDAVIGSGFPRVVFDAELQSLASRNIPVINLSVNDTAGDGMTAVIGAGDVRNSKVGEIQAAWTLSQKGQDTNAVFVQVPAFPTHISQAEGFKSAYESLCQDCPLDVVDMPAESMGTDLPQRLVGYLQSHPDVNVVALAYGDMAIGVPSAIAAAGMSNRVVMVTDAPDPTVATYIGDDNVVVAATGYPGPEMTWRAIDIVLRTMNGADVAPSADAPLPQWVVTSSTIPSTTEAFPLVADYRAEYLKLWGKS